MTLTLLVGPVAVLAVLAGFLTWIRWPTHEGCPACGASTVAVTAALPRLLRRHVWQRWCAECGWSGHARRGPDLSDGPVDHDSGFRWSARPSAAAPTFLWGPVDGGADETPAHPSGFRWRSPRRPFRFPDPTDAPADDPSGFRWARSDEER